MSYYASDNSLDGQPRIDKVNILKFYPVFAIQDSIKSVNVTIYYGNKTHEAYADRMNRGKYWQILLPEFKLGDAMQRVEVEMRFLLPENYTSSYSLLNFAFSDSLKKIEKEINEKKESLKISSQKLSEYVREHAEFTGLKKMDIINITYKLIPLINIDNYNNINYLSKELRYIITTVPFIRDYDRKTQDSILAGYITFMETAHFDSLTALALDRYLISSNLEKDYKRRSLLNEEFEDHKQQIINELFNEIIDTSFTGPAIRKSDLVISDDFNSVKLLYRYYKNNLRYRKALDPAESLGIFRARYVPLPVVGTPGDNKVQLLRPMEAHVPVVFEIGLAFGDEVVSGDNTFEPALSLSRLGVAIVITEKLFKADAEILGIAFTYDFNSYASIGFGRNLAQGQSFPYFSFGINKKAFEQLLVGLAGLFD